MIQFVLIVLLGLCTVEAAWHGMWWKALYWFGALLVTVAVVKGIKT